MGIKKNFSSIFPDIQDDVLFLKEDFKESDEIIFDMDLEIKSAKTEQNRKFKIICPRIIIETRKLEFDNIIFEGSLILRKNARFYANNCDFSNGDSGSGGIITQAEGCRCKFRNSCFHDSETDGVFSEDCEILHFENCKFYNIKKHCIHSFRILDVCILNCEFNDILRPAEKFEGTCIKSNLITKALISNCKFNNCATCVKFQHSGFVNVINTSFSLIKETSCTFESSNFSIIGCEFKNLQCSAVITRFCKGDKNEVSTSIFDHIDGNCILSDESILNISSNNMQHLKYPSIAVLQETVANIKDNKISDCSRSGICIRKGGTSTIEYNKLSNIGESGFSISDSKMVHIRNNTIENCENCFLESYNESDVNIENNTITNGGNFIFSAYTLGCLRAYKNTIDSKNSYLLNISTKGSAYINDNKILGILPTSYKGNTKGVFTIADNIGVDDVTNDKELAESKGYTLESNADYKPMKCAKCKINDIDCVFQPCGHSFYCSECYDKSIDKCPLCRFPIENFVRADIIQILKGQESCSICRENIADSIILPCGHLNCSDCLNKWFKNQNFCPICRTDSSSYKKILNFE